MKCPFCKEDHDEHVHCLVPENVRIRARIAELEASLAEADMWAVDHCEYVAPEAYDALEAKVRELEMAVAARRLR